ncbi:hypothetical protein SULI_13660 [Saccharolobus solfataricus]|uniref:Uncharacterized protein n=3 Tax=Saccharolobus solfataricus TaxID=2287 RepID=Q97XC7_SACS2|nr:hypothetical protein [Saccharolobus solfataricus]AAK42014.1 Hypothetical protein SSO8998 [Saccharolobus solfataricus P2]AKA74762.1 hypothetical protein SULB_2682 [Saccharolobus solfataricus]AKA77458.1 hypothetical protein SULC_2679 [Saccharolobus solfataricus]AKA80148.1 hypothetical protein SULA_2681 [Saccharolobus solfataricus]AZF69229.1 hypothetical protein SULG_13660 [Saccharolobus solfataricus]
MKVIEKIKLDRTESCGSKSPLSIMLDAIRKIKECDESVEILMNDYDWLLSLKYILQVNDKKMKVEEKGSEEHYLKVEVSMDCSQSN